MANRMPADRVVNGLTIFEIHVGIGAEGNHTVYLKHDVDCYDCEDMNHAIGTAVEMIQKRMAGGVTNYEEGEATPQGY